MSELMLKSLNYTMHTNYSNLGIYYGLFNNSHLLFVDTFYTHKASSYWFNSLNAPAFPIDTFLKLPTINELTHIKNNMDYINYFKLTKNSYFHIDNLYYWPNRNININTIQLLFVNRIY